MADVLKTLREAVAVAVAKLGPSIEAGVIQARIETEGRKRAETFGKAVDVLIKLKGELNKIKPDVQAIKKEDGTELQAAGWTDKNLKLRKETLERYLALEKLLNTTSDLQMAIDPNAQVIQDAYTKLQQGTDKASKGVKDAPAESDSD